VHASLIEGGQEYSSYPGRCVLIGERRTLPGESLGDVELELAGLVAGTGASARITFARGPFELGADDGLGRIVARSAGADRLEGVPFWTDAALLAAAGIPTVVFGPRGAGAHATEEWVELASLDRCAEVYLEVARRACSPDG
jgi:acetylornithine deacetylase